MKRTLDLGIAVTFFALGFFVVIESFGFPPGIERMPGPGFFPQLIGFTMMLLAALVAAQSFTQALAIPLEIENKAAVLSVLALTLAYVSLWGTGAFAIRTMIFLTLLLRLLGERWREAITVALVISAGIVLGFSYGLRLSLE